MSIRNIIVLNSILLTLSTSSHAICVYGGNHFTKSNERDFNGRLYAKTTIADEFQDAALVIRGTVLSSQSIGLDPPNDSGWGTVYRIRIITVFKGKGPSVILDYSDRDSGGFYLGEGGEGLEYLLFLNPIERTSWAKKLVPEAYRVNYSCGQSRPWTKVNSEAVKQLNSLARKP